MADGSIVAGSALRMAPTVCLLISDGEFSASGLSSVIENTLAAGCKFYMTWGNSADHLHDAVDEILEQHGTRYESVVTTAHRDESPEDTAWFFLNAALPGESRVQYCLSYSEHTSAVQKLLETIENFGIADS